MKRLRLDGPENIVEDGVKYVPGQEMEVSDNRAKALLTTKGLHLSAVKQKAEETVESEPAERGGAEEKGGKNGTV